MTTNTFHNGNREAATGIGDGMRIEAEFWNDRAVMVDSLPHDDTLFANVEFAPFQPITRIRGADVIAMAFCTMDNFDRLYTLLVSFANSQGYDAHEYYGRVMDDAIALREERLHAKFVESGLAVNPIK